MSGESDEVAGECGGGAGIAGAVLAGGQSRRFGSDKAHALIEGVPLATVAARALRSRCAEVHIVGKGGRGLEELRAEGIRFVADSGETSHPLVGLLTALETSCADRVVVVACDAPLIRPELIDLLVARAGDAGAVVCCYGGRRHPFPGLYRRDSAPTVRAVLSGREASMQRLLDAVAARELGEEEVRKADPDGRSFLDADTTDALVRLREAARLR